MRLHRLLVPTLATWLALATCGVGAQLAPVPPNLGAQPQAVAQHGVWTVVRSPVAAGRPACSARHRDSRLVQLTRDRFVLRSPVELTRVALGFDAQPLRPPRPLRDDEQALGALVLQGEEFAQLRRSTQLRVEADTVQGTGRQVLDLTGLPQALQALERGCAVARANPR